jgi:hypothetical protein
MREIRPYGSEGGEDEPNRLSLPLFFPVVAVEATINALSAFIVGLSRSPRKTAEL